MERLLKVNTLMFGLVISLDDFQAYAIDFSTALMLKEHTQKNANFLLYSKLGRFFVTREVRKEVLKDLIKTI